MRKKAVFRLCISVLCGTSNGQTMSKSLKILLVDDHEVVRLGLKALLSRTSQFEVVAEAANASEAIDRVARYQPDVVVMDIRLPGKNGIEATREIVAQHPEVKVIMLTSFAEDELLFDAIAAGASGYVLKQIGSNELVTALEKIGRGESLVDPSLMQKVFARVREASRKAEDQAFADLSEQELKILAAVSKGKTNKEIAEAVFLSEKTVRNYVSSILSKLNLSTRSEAAAYAVTHRIQDHLQTD
jgi:two-component system response regulator DevR